jgi:hypothetical protein
VIPPAHSDAFGVDGLNVGAIVAIEAMEAIVVTSNANTGLSTANKKAPT